MIDKILDYEIRKQLQKAFRRGYYHGFSDGISAHPDEFEELKKNVLYWREDLSEQFCPPGSKYFKNTISRWYDLDEPGAVKDSYREKYEMLLEQKALEFRVKSADESK